MILRLCACVCGDVFVCLYWCIDRDAQGEVDCGYTAHQCRTDVSRGVTSGITSLESDVEGCFEGAADDPSMDLFRNRHAALYLIA